MTTVREVMSTDLVTVPPSATVMEASRVMFASKTGSTLVMDGPTLVGIFTERDILRALSGESDAGRSSAIVEHMTSRLETIGPDAAVGEALDRMLFGNFRHLPVVESERLIGVVSMRDLAGALAKRRPVRGG
jgi:CBS domain-containing protein